MGEGKRAALAQLEERGSHNPEVVSSILTSRISFSISFRLGTSGEHANTLVDARIPSIVLPTIAVISRF